MSPAKKESDLEVDDFPYPAAFHS